MSKILKFKKWLTVEDAAKRLSISAGEDVTEADILRLALDGHLTLSMYFVNHAMARKGKIVPLSDTRWSFMPPLLDLPNTEPLTDEAVALYPEHLQKLWHETPSEERPKCIPMLSSLAIDDNRFINFEDEVTKLTDIWDLPFIGCERLDVEHEYQSLTGGPEVTLEGLDGAFVSQGENTIFQLQESWDQNPYQAGSLAQLERLKEFIREKTVPAEKADDLLQKHKAARVDFLEEQRSRPVVQNFYPAGGLPRDGVLVVRTSALRELEEKLLADDRPPEKPLHPSERKSTGQIIAAMAAMAGLDLSTPYKAVEALRKTAAVHGIELPSSDETIVKFLKGAAASTGKV